MKLYMKLLLLYTSMKVYMNLLLLCVIIIMNLVI